MGVASGKIKTTDKIVRKTLIHDLSIKDDIQGIFEEFDVIRGKARADIVAVTKGALHAYEIKSDVDTLLRLAGQVKYYNRVFTSVTLVVGTEHAVKALYIIPDWWGVVVAKSIAGEVRLLHVRAAKKNKRINDIYVSDLLHREELIEILDRHAPGCTYSKMSKIKLISETKDRLSREFFIKNLSSTILSRGKCTYLGPEIAL